MSISRQNLTVVIVTLKSQHIIDKCIQSIDRNISIIIVENSDDEVFKIILRINIIMFHAYFPKVILVWVQEII